MFNKSRKILSIVLTLVMMISFCAPSFAADKGNHVHSRELVSVPYEKVPGYKIPGYFYCKECGEYYYDKMTTEDLGMPILDLTGSFSGMSKENKVKVGVSYQDSEQSFSCNGTLKFQGSSSIQYPKKNYTITLLKEDGSKNKVCFNEEWGKQSKYVLKANYVDYSQSRNVVSAKLWGEIVKSRNKGDRIESLVNGGAIDGYPVLVFHYGEFLGLYTLNIPKDDWLFGMGDKTKHEAILFGDDWSDSVSLKEEIAEDHTESSWDIEYCSTEETEEGTGWIRDSFNKFISFLNSCDKEDFNNHIGDYIDIDSAIDLFIFTVFLHANDNTSKNVIWATYDGDYWIPSAYDLDGTFGLRYDGELCYSSSDFSFSGYNKLYELILKYKAAELKSRYVELRSDILSVENIKNKFSQFFSLIPDFVYEAESLKWTEVKNQKNNNYDQIINYVTKRVNVLDKYFDVRIIEKGTLANKVSFTRAENAEIAIYSGIDLTKNPEVTLAGWSLNANSGYYTKKNGVVYFKVTTEIGYAVEDIIVSDDSTVLTPDDTGVKDLYGIKGINENISVKLKIKEIPINAYKVSFVLPDGIKAYVYDSSDFKGTGSYSESAYSIDPITGQLTDDGTGLVSFRLETEKGIEIDRVVVTPRLSYDEILMTNIENTDPEEETTAAEETTSAEETTVSEETTSEESSSPEETTVPEESTSVEETTTEENTTSDEDTTLDEETTVPEETSDSETTTDPETTTVTETTTVFSENNQEEEYFDDAVFSDNTVITVSGIKCNITVTVYTKAEPLQDDDGYSVTFIHDEDVAVRVYSGQNYNLESELTDISFSADAETGFALSNGEGQVNFLVELPVFTELVGIEITADSYKNIKGPTDTGLENVYRITKITGDITVSIITETHNYTASYTVSDTDPYSGHNAFCECGKSIFEAHKLNLDYIDGKLLSSCSICDFSVEMQLGDADTDGKITVSDARLILRAAVNLDSIDIYSAAFYLADIDGDEKLTVSDARLCLRAAVNLEEDLWKYHPDIETE